MREKRLGALFNGRRAGFWNELIGIDLAGTAATCYFVMGDWSRNRNICKKSQNAWRVHSTRQLLTLLSHYASASLLLDSPKFPSDLLVLLSYANLLQAILVDLNTTRNSGVSSRSIHKCCLFVLTLPKVES